MNVRFSRLTHVTEEICAVFSRWENDPGLLPFTRPNRTGTEVVATGPVSIGELTCRSQSYPIFLVYDDDTLIGEVTYQVDPAHLFLKEAGTAWISITIGEPAARGRGVGRAAMGFLEGEIRRQGLRRIELGVFEFNAPAISLYRKTGYREIGRIEDFTFWNDRFWQDIRMEKRFCP